MGVNHTSNYFGRGDEDADFAAVGPHDLLEGSNDLGGKSQAPVLRHHAKEVDDGRRILRPTQELAHQRPLLLPAQCRVGEERLDEGRFGDDRLDLPQVGLDFGERVGFGCGCEEGTCVAALQAVQLQRQLKSERIDGDDGEGVYYLDCGVGSCKQGLELFMIIIMVQLSYESGLKEHLRFDSEEALANCC